MSANNWRICPSCKKKNDKANEDRILDAAKQYGKIPAGEYIDLAKKAGVPIEIEETFREDFEIGIDEDGSFHVSYRGACQECSAEFTYKFEEALAIKDCPND